jgi:hypothetical protein
MFNFKILSVSEPVSFATDTNVIVRASGTLHKDSKVIEHTESFVVPLRTNYEAQLKDKMYALCYLKSKTL